VANSLAPGLLDRYLARTNYRAQQRAEARDPHQYANLWQPVEGDPGAHGPFDEQAHPRSFQLWAAKKRRWVLAGAVSAATASVIRRAH
jgi:hypothetical protein